VILECGIHPCVEENFWAGCIVCGFEDIDICARGGFFLACLTEKLRRFHVESDDVFGFDFIVQCMTYWGL
jgi:hypothetical protein